MKENELKRQNEADAHQAAEELYGKSQERYDLMERQTAIAQHEVWKKLDKI